MDIESLFEKRGLLAGVELGVKPPESTGTHVLPISFDAPHGIVKSVKGHVTETWETDRMTALFEALRAKAPKHFGGKVEKQTPRLLILKVAKPASRVEVRHYRHDDGDSDTVSIDVVLDESAMPPLSAKAVGLDGPAVGRALATKKFSASEIERAAVEIITRFDSKAHQAWNKIIAAAAKEHAKRKADVVEAMLRAAPWSELRDGYNDGATRLMTGVMSTTLAYRFDRTPRPGWTSLTLTDLNAVLELLPEADRSEGAAYVFRALERGDPAALDWVRARLAAPGPVVGGAFDATDEIEARLFGLFAEKLGTELEVLALPFRTSTSNAARAAVTWFARERSLEVKPVLAPGGSRDWRLASESLATYFGFVKQHFPQQLDAVVEKFSQRSALFNAEIIEVIGAAAGERVSKTVFVIGATQFTVRGRNVVAAPASVKPKKKPARS
ncbi:MAG: hypothetical protein QM817_11005 [Archangium sp.]